MKKCLSGGKRELIANISVSRCEVTGSDLHPWKTQFAPHPAADGEDCLSRYAEAGQGPQGGEHQLPFLLRE